MTDRIKEHVTLTEIPGDEGTRMLTFLHDGVGGCCWRGGVRTFKLDRYGIATLVAVNNQCAEIIGSSDDSHERCYGDSCQGFTRWCLEQIYSKKGLRHLNASTAASL